MVVVMVVMVVVMVMVVVDENAVAMCRWWKHEEHN